MTTIPVSVCVPAHNEEQYISTCISSLLQQTFRDYEIVVIDDCSTDKTASIVASFGDDRIRYFKNEVQSGVARSRNRGAKESRGRYLFFVDGDSSAGKNWVEKGVGVLEESGCDGVEGKVVYVAEDYRPTMVDHRPLASSSWEHPGHFLGGNVAYRRDAFERAGGFDEKCDLEDRELALKVIRDGGKICYSSEMVVYHPREVWTIKSYVKSGSAIKCRVHLFKEFGDKEKLWWRVVYPRSLAVALCPPLIFLSFAIYSYRKWEDFRLLPFVYVRALYSRLCLWRECIRERVFLI